MIERKWREMDRNAETKLFRLFRSRRKQLLFTIDQLRDIVAGELKSMPMRDRIGRTGFDAVSAEDTAIVVDIVDGGMTLARADAFFGGIFSSLNVNAVGWASGSAQEASHTLFKTSFVALQHM